MDGDGLTGRPFGRIDPRRESPPLVAVVVTKALLIASLFWAYGFLRQLPVALFLFLLKASAAVVYVLLQKPLSSGKRISRAMWARIVQYSVLVGGTGLLWALGLTLCGPLRTILLWEHSEIALLSAVSSLLAMGSAKGRSALFFVAAVFVLVLFDNDRSAPPTAHTSSARSSVTSHTMNWISSFVGFPDHRGGVLLLLLGLCLMVVQRKVGRKLSVDLGGHKRLQALSTLVVAILLMPWALYQFMTLNVSIPWSEALSCLVLTALLQVADYYTTSIATQKVDHHRLASTSSLATFLWAFSLACAMWWFLPPTDHTLSAGVVIATVLFVLATPSLTRPLSRSHGILVGYSTSGLPLYQSHEKSPPSFLRALQPAFVKIMENSDSRRIFYFLILNLAFTVVELLYGVWTNSLGLISDGFHMLFDCTALLLGLYASLMSRWKPTRLYSYGYGRVEVLSGFVNALFLMVIAVFVLEEALDRLVDPPSVSTKRLLFVSVAGFLVNLIGIATFSRSHAHSHGGHTHNANMQGMFLHVLADTMGSVGVIISSLLIQQYGWYIADPICSLFIAILILVSVLPLLKASAEILLLATPSHHSIHKTLNKLSKLDGVLTYTDAHFWLHSSETIAGTLHVQVAPSANEQRVITMVTNFLKSELGVSMLTLQVEKDQFTCCEITQSYVKQLAQTTPPQVYVDYGPHAGEVKAV